MKKILVIMILALGLFDTSAFAATSKNQNNLDVLTKNKGEIIYQDKEITVTSFGTDKEIANAIANDPNTIETGIEKPQPNQSDSVVYIAQPGDGGISRIDRGDDRQSVYWSVTPKTLWPYNFEGEVKLRYHSGFKRDVPIGGMGALGSTVSGKVTMNKNNGGVAYLSGTAYSMTFDKYRVLPGVHTSF